MGKRKRTPTKRALAQHAKRSKGLPRKERPKLSVTNSPHTSISHADRMKIVLLAEAGKTPSNIASIIGCTYKTAVNLFLVLVSICPVRNCGVIVQRKF